MISRWWIRLWSPKPRSFRFQIWSTCKRQNPKNSLVASSVSCRSIRKTFMSKATPLCGGLTGILSLDGATSAASLLIRMQSARVKRERLKRSRESTRLRSRLRKSRKKRSRSWFKNKTKSSSHSKHLKPYLTNMSRNLISLLLRQKALSQIKNPLQEIAVTHLVPETERKLKAVEGGILHLQAAVSIALPAIKSLRNLLKKMKSERESGNTILLEPMRLKWLKRSLRNTRKSDSFLTTLCAASIDA